MTEEAENLQDAPVQDEAPQVEDSTESVVEEQKDEQETPETSSDSSTDKEQGRDPVQEKINKLTKARRAAEREADYWRNQAATKPEAPKETAPEQIKTLADFDYDESEYQAYFISQARQGAVEEARRVFEEQQSKEVTTRKVSEFNQRQDEFAVNIDDYDEVIRNPDLTITREMADVTLEMENGPAVLYYLGKNPDIAEKIASLSPLSAARELGKIEVTIAKKEAEKVSKAPAPAPKLAAGDPAINKSLDDMSQKEFNAYRRKVIANRRR